MKDACFTIEVVSHILANSTGPNGERDVFQRDANDDLVFQQSAWYSAFAQAIDLAHVKGIKASDINMNLSVSADTEAYERRYQGDKFRTHEAIVPGTRVKFEAVVADHVTDSNLTLILDRMGKFVGFSPYGYRLGQGKFNLVSVVIAPSEGQLSDEQRGNI